MKKILILICIALVFGCASESTSPTGNQSDSRSSTGSSTGTGGSLARFTIAKNHLYIATESELFTYSLATSSKPQFLNKIRITEGVETIFSLGDFLYIGTQGGMIIYDITQASAPSFASNYWHVTSCDPVVANEDHAFVTLRSGTACQRGDNRLDIIDIENKRSPSLVRSISLEQPIGLGLHNDFLYVCDNSKIKRFDISSALFPVEEESIALPGVFDIIINNNILIAVHPEGVTQYAIGENGTLGILSTITKD